MSKKYYDKFTQQQLVEYKKKLHSSIHWLLIYKEADDYEFFDIYFDSLLLKIECLNEILGDQEEILILFTTLLAAKKECTKEDYDFRVFRKLILDAHNLLDKINFKGV